MRRLIAVVAFCAIAGCSGDLSPEGLHTQLAIQGGVVRAWTFDPVLMSALDAQNAQHLTLAQIQSRDAAWVSGTANDLVQATITGACADRLRRLIGSFDYYGETFLMDNQGALVCSTDKTSDYWQGDEAKFINSFKGGAGATFIDKPQFDTSANENLTQISVPVMVDGHAIGSMTVGVLSDRLR